MANNRQAGFTLIELIVAITISSALAVIALVGFSNLRGQTQFSNAVEQTKEFVTSQRTETYAGVELTGGGDKNLIFFGRLLTFSAGTITVQTLVTINGSDPLPGQAVFTSPGSSNTNDITYVIPYSVAFDFSGPGQRQLAFVRSPVDGTLRTVTSGGNASFSAAALQYSDFIPASPITTPVRYPVSDGTRSATVNIEPITNAIGRTFN